MKKCKNYLYAKYNKMIKVYNKIAYNIKIFLRLEIIKFLLTKVLIRKQKNNCLYYKYNKKIAKTKTLLQYNSNF